LAINNKQSVTVAYIDYCKAFDSVCHNKLFVKLKAYGVGGNLLHWIEDFLRNRSQTTQVGSQYSNERYLSSGIVQGSCIGPLLFLLYINDVIEILPSDCVCKLFADDLKLYSVAKITEDSMHVMQESLDNLFRWSNKWQLSISYKKCSVMSFGRTYSDNCCFYIGNNIIQSVNTHKDLGVHLDTNLTFCAHINNIVAKSHTRAGLIRKCFLSNDPGTLVKAFTTYVRPLLEYASVIWSPYHTGDIDKVESVQRRFTKRLAGMQYLSYADRLHTLQLESLEMRRLRFDLLYTYKILFGLVHIDSNSLFKFNPVTVTRGHCYKLYAATSRINVRHNFFCNRIVNVWNALPASAANFTSYNCFRSFLFSVDLSKLV